MPKISHLIITPTESTQERIKMDKEKIYVAEISKELNYYKKEYEVITEFIQKGYINKEEAEA